MLRFLSPESLATAATRRPWTVIGIWIVVLVVSAGFASRVGDALTTDMAVLTSIEADEGEKLLLREFPTDDAPDEYVVLQAESLTVDDAGFQEVAEGLINGIRENGEAVLFVANYYETEDPSLVSADGRTLVIPVAMEGEPADLHELVDPIIEEVHAVNGLDGFLAATGGRGSIDKTWIETSESDLRQAEMIGLPMALVVLVFVFGALVAAGLPILFAISGIVVAVGLTSIIGMQYDLSVFVLNMITMIGLAVGIDYTLLVIQRFREERQKGLERDLAIQKAGATASRAVLFSGMAVVVALSGMLFVPDTIFRSLSVGAILVVFAAVSAALTFLPAMLRLLGDRVNIGTLPGRRAIPGREGGRIWAQTARFVMARPIISVVLSAGLLIAMAIPYFDMEMGMSGAATLPEGSDAATAFAILDEEFNAGVLAPTEIMVEGSADDPDVAAGIEALDAAIAEDGLFTPLTVATGESGNYTRLTTAIQGDSQSDAAFDAVDRLREVHLPAAFGERETFVTGQTAWAMDYAGMLDTYTPIVFAFVLGLSFIILLVVFRSIIVPLKSIVLNLLSVGAAYGAMVMVFQYGWGADTLGLTQVDRVESWVPLMMFAILFGLSMDYHVFLLTRIRERFNQTGDNRGSVAYGVRATAGLITGAAAIMIVVFSGFASGDLVMMQQFGLGLAVSVFVDASIVRVVLVPASMALLGKWNWYFPSWLEWMPHVDVEGTHAARDIDESAGLAAPAPASEPAG